MTPKSRPFHCSLEFRDYGSQRASQDEDILGKQIRASAAVSRTIAAVLEKHRGYFAKRLFANLLSVADASGRALIKDFGVALYMRENVSPFVDYLVRYFRTADRTWLVLYTGEKLRVFEEISHRRLETREIENLLHRESRCFMRRLGRELSAEAGSLAAAVFEDIAASACHSVHKQARVLLIGDCLYTDVVDFLRPNCARDGLGIEPVRITSKNPEETREEIRKHASSKFDAVFFSPFSYEYSREYAWLLSWKGRNAEEASYNAALQEILRQTRDTIEVLTDLYDCSIFVHNCSMLRRREPNPAVDLAKYFLTRGRKRAAQLAINTWLADYVVEKNLATFDHLYIVDEEGLVRSFGERTLGRPLFWGNALHTSMLGRVLADYYRDILYCLSRLQGKKVIVCDLDNTLWRGLIGEGNIVPHQDRQELLQRLKQKGILLTVCSKNNPNDVRWERNLLGPDDFVSTRINWDPKPHNVQSIEQELNLKRKDFVFVDDSTLETTLMSTTFPEISVLNADEKRSWRLLLLWDHLLGRGSSEDRTAYYLKEKQRSKFIEPSRGSGGDLSGPLRDLQLRVTVREAQKSDLQRALELINRTNQFNLCGTRTNFHELTAWLRSEDHKILVAEAEDKFGPMGTVCITVVRFTRSEAEIPVFVLSCRVIGYGIESAMLNYVRMLSEDGERAIVGHCRETAHNQPCRRMYPNHGFEADATGRWRRGGGEMPVPSWLTVNYAVASHV